MRTTSAAMQPARAMASAWTGEGPSRRPSRRTSSPPAERPTKRSAAFPLEGDGRPVGLRGDHDGRYPRFMRHEARDPSSSGGCVLKRLARDRPESGFTMNRCAVAGPGAHRDPLRGHAPACAARWPGPRDSRPGARRSRRRRTRASGSPPSGSIMAAIGARIIRASRRRAGSPCRRRRRPGMNGSAPRRRSRPRGWPPPCEIRVSRFSTCDSSWASTPSSSSRFMARRRPSVAATAACFGLRPVANALSAASGDDVQLRHRDARLHGQPLHDRVQLGRLLRASRLRVVHAQDDLVAPEQGAEVHDAGHDQGEGHAAAPAQGLAHDQEQAGEGPQQQRRLHRVHGVVRLLISKLRAITPAGNPQSARGGR